VSSIPVEVVLSESPLKINPPKMCQLVGAVFATLGVHNAVPLIHGSQGCANFVKHLMTKHFKEPVEVATTAINEKYAVMGGEQNLITAIENLKRRLNPDLIVVMTTCLTETIGENIQIASRFDGVVAVSTPSYAGTHIDGYDRTIKALISSLAEDWEEREEDNARRNLITGFVNPGDVRELKHICKEMDVDYILLTDLTALDQPLGRRRRSETTANDIRNTASSDATIYFGTEGISGAKLLESFGIPSYALRFPIGIENTDRFVATLAKIAGVEVPDSLLDCRGYAIDAIIDASSVLRGKKVAIFGDPDKVIALTDFAFEMGMRVIAVLAPIRSRHFAREIERIANENDAKIVVFENADLYQLHKFVKDNPVDLLIGDYRGRYIAEAERIPLLRVGFPVCDRFGYHRKPMLGYGGALRIAEEIANLLVSGCYG